MRRKYKGVYHAIQVNRYEVDAGYERWLRADKTDGYFLNFWDYLESDCTVALSTHGFRHLAYLTQTGSERLTQLLGPHGHTLAKIYLARKSHE